MNDYIAYYLGAVGIQAALIRRAKEGGSYHAVNLARCAMWFMSLGKFDKTPQAPPTPAPDPDTDSITAQTPYGNRSTRSTGEVLRNEALLTDPVLVVRGRQTAMKASWTRIESRTQLDPVLLD
jgi:hypothetical protein